MGTDRVDDGFQLTAKFPSRSVLAGAHDEDMVVEIRAPGARALVAPPKSIALVVDRSGSMRNSMAQARAAAHTIVDKLGEDDALAIVEYSSSDETVMGMTRATDEGKRAAHAAIDRIAEDGGGTCISCGIERGTRELSHTPIVGGLAHMVLISDGQANEGIYDRSFLADFAAETAAKGVSISTVGLGIDFDEVTMMRIAEVGHGNYYFAEDVTQLGAMFDRELTALADVVAADVKLTVTPGAGAVIQQVYGYGSPMVSEGRDSLSIPIANLRAGEVRKVVMRTRVAASAAEPDGRVRAAVRMTWRRVSDGKGREGTAHANATFTTDAAAVRASIDPGVVLAVEQAHAARTLDEAAAIYQRDGYTAAERVLQTRTQEMRANPALSGADADALEATFTQTIDGFAHAPARTLKTARETAYHLAR